MINYLKSFFSAAKPIEAKATRQNVPYLQVVGTTTPFYSATDYTAIVDEAYKKNDLVYAAVSAISGAALEAELMGMNDAGDMVESKGLMTLQNPNPHQSDNEFLERLIISTLLSGGFFIHKQKDGFGNVTGLYLLDPAYMKVIPDAYAMKSGYVYTITGVEKRLELEEVIHGIVFPDPVTPIDMMSPLVSAFRQIDTDNEATNHIKYLLENRGVPGIVLSTDDVLPVDYLERLKAMIDSGYSGKKRGSAMVLEGGLKPAQLGLTPADMDYATLRLELEARICSVLGVPPVIIGTKLGLDRSTFSNFEEARRIFWQDTICPLFKKIASIFERDPDLNPEGLYFHYDYSDAPAMQSINAEHRNNIIAQYQVGIITLDEVRAELGYEPLTPEQVAANAEQYAEEEPEEDATKDLRTTTHIESKEICACGSCHAQKAEKSIHETKADRAPLKILRSIMGRHNIADKAYTPFKALVKGLLVEQQSDILALVDEAASEKAIIDWLTFKFTMRKLKGKWAEKANEQVNPVMAKIIGQAARQTASSELGIDFDIDRPQIREALADNSFKFAESFSNTSSDKFYDIFSEAEAKDKSLAELRQDIMDTFEGMTEHRAETIARTETMRMANKGARLAYKEAGVTQLQWLTADGDACAYCQALDGTIVGVEESFIKQGHWFQPEGAQPLNTKYGDVQGGDAHPNCRCAVIPVVE